MSNLEKDAIEQSALNESLDCGAGCHLHARRIQCCDCVNKDATVTGGHYRFCLLSCDDGQDVDLALDAIKYRCKEYQKAI